MGCYRSLLLVDWSIGQTRRKQVQQSLENNSLLADYIDRYTYVRVYRREVDITRGKSTRNFTRLDDIPRAYFKKSRSYRCRRLFLSARFSIHDGVDSDSRLENTRWPLEGDTFGKEKYATDNFFDVSRIEDLCDLKIIMNNLTDRSLIYFQIYLRKWG